MKNSAQTKSRFIAQDHRSRKRTLICILCEVCTQARIGPPEEKGSKTGSKTEGKREKGVDELPPNKQTISNTAKDRTTAATLIINSGGEGDREPDMNNCAVKDNSSDESDWEVFDFMSSENSYDEGLP